MIQFDRAPEVCVGILTAEEIRLEFKGNYYDDRNDLQLSGLLTARNENGRILLRGDCTSFVLDKEVWLRHENAGDTFKVFQVSIGIGFHWETNEEQVFRGGLKILVNGKGLTIINVIPVEDYLVSVISSEMSAHSSTELLKAHAVISRGWLLAQIEKGRKLKKKNEAYKSIFENENERVKWYDREDHEDFDVCADDHCQRYQGITRAVRPEVDQAVMDTCGEVLISDNNLCDTRFSKCCGGVTEKFENVWEPVTHPYLQRIYDNNGTSADTAGDLSDEENARRWIKSNDEAFCNNTDSKVLSQVLNDYDQSTHDFYRWSVTLKGKELGELIRKKINIDFGAIEDLVPVQRGASGRLIKLKIIGSKKTMTIGKELEIRKALSPNHLYSSAFVVDKRKLDDDNEFILHGAGWGHGVGLCQIGAAVMGEKGYNYKEILNHYFRGAELTKVY
ncbi:MAG TPA: SpoIID/LytB domain-containing protein [Bacteroidales bacterium]|nr:SpoIID/LytB domain-containing protein [Bacteroidales bacterium]